MKTEVCSQAVPGKRDRPVDGTQADGERDSSGPEFPEHFIPDRDGDRDLVTVTFSLRNTKNSNLSRALKIFEAFEAQIHHVESRPSRKGKGGMDDLDFFIRCEINNSAVNSLLNSLRRVAEDVCANKEEKVPWFPRKIQDLDRCHHLITKFEPDLDQAHPGYQDLEYRERRSNVARLAFHYKQGESLPRVDYTAEERATWKEVYTKLSTLYPSHACKQFLDAFHILEKHCGYQADNIPQLQDVSNFLKEICCHELLGHIPMLADKQVCTIFTGKDSPLTDRSQRCQNTSQGKELGLASLGASDEDIEKLSTLYWFTIEFGLCRQNGVLKAYGAGLLSSYGELMYSLSGEPQYKAFDPEVTAMQTYQDQTFQPVYFVSESFEDAKSKLWMYACKIRRPFSLRYDPLTCSVELLDKPHKIKKALTQIADELKNLCFALDKLS